MKGTLTMLTVVACFFAIACSTCFAQHLSFKVIATFDGIPPKVGHQSFLLTRARYVGQQWMGPTKPGTSIRLSGGIQTASFRFDVDTNKLGGFEIDITAAVPIPKKVASFRFINQGKGKFKFFQDKSTSPFFQLGPVYYYASGNPSPPIILMHRHTISFGAKTENNIYLYPKYNYGSSDTL